MRFLHNNFLVELEGFAFGNVAAAAAYAYFVFAGVGYPFAFVGVKAGRVGRLKGKRKGLLLAGGQQGGFGKGF
jgi:hypothetical protein